LTPFVYQSHPSRVLFGPARLDSLADEIVLLGARRAFVVATPEQAPDADRIVRQIGDLACGAFCGARMHTPVDVTEAAMAALADADCLIAIGGGSTIGLAKAIALRTDLPQIAIPTTYAGSEATAIIGQTENGIKTTQTSPRVLPEVILYDVNLTMGLPVAISVVSGMNAIAHAVEGLYSEQANPIISLIAQEGIRALASALPRISAAPTDVPARSDAQYGAWLCGTTLGAVGMALHHKLCHALGGTFDLPHAQTHAVILPHALAYNAPYAADAVARIGTALGRPDAAMALYDLNRSLGAPTSLRELGMPHGGLDRVIELTFAKPYWNPAPLDKVRLRMLVERAWDGLPPAS